MGGSQRRTAAGLIGIWALLVALAGSVSWVAIASVGQGLGQSLPGNRSPLSAGAPSEPGSTPAPTTPIPSPSPSSSPPTVRPAPSVTVTKTLTAGARPTVTVTTRVTTTATTSRGSTGDRETFSTRGGAATVRCDAGEPVLVGTRPKSGWSVTWSKRSGQFVVRFRQDGDAVELTVGCADGQPVRVG